MDDEPSNKRARFSGALQLTDLNDYLKPEQACIKPVKLDTSEGKKVKSILVDNETGQYIQENVDGSKKELEKTQITLADCLACSGCVTSAESVLVNQQSLEEFERYFETKSDEEKVFVLSIAPQSRASIAAFFQTDITTALKKLTSFFKTNYNARYVLDTNWSRHFSHLEIIQEFMDKYKNNKLPLLASACPGFVCYAEKSHGEDVLPLISTSKSPMQVMGSVVKSYLSKQMNVKPSNIYHASIMMCFDKKLEASRDDFLWDPNDVNAHEVDIVLTSSEVVELLQKKGVKNPTDFQNIPSEVIDETFSELEHLGNGVVPTNGPFLQSTGSGGYAEVVFRYASKHLFGITLPEELKYKTGRNSDLKELILSDPNDPSKILLRFAVANGFRNIQNIIRKLKPNARAGYHFVEVMACPSGCLNGGGQTTPAENTATGRRDYLKTVSDLYFSNDKNKSSDGSDYDVAHSKVKKLYEEWIGGDVYSEQAKKLLHTRYHAREKLAINPLAIKW
ncbi:cytosolic iron-sulfur assembly component 3 [Acrasis kona]|uniref:Cytosolic iron-sulfur assembly component 3 n=1 Tax=Acrasis kona TaxID=1008807 RepID=A0AAW2YVF4_9EUKA